MNSNQLSNHIAEEAHLLAEEKWIIEALSKIKNQRNGLQIERLHLESLKAQIKTKNKDTNIKSHIKEPCLALEEASTSTSTVNMMQSHVVPCFMEIQLESNSIDSEAYCNDEALNLAVSSAVLGTAVDPLQFEEEYECEDNDDIVLDINMLMNGDEQKVFEL